MDVAARTYLPERLDVADIRRRGPGAHHHADLREGEIDLAASTHEASLHELVGGFAIQDHDVGELASREAVGMASGESPIDGPRVVTRRWPVARLNAGPSSA